MIQSANINHLKQVLDIEKKVFFRPWTHNQLKMDLSGFKDVENLVYVVDGEVIGYVLGNFILDEFHLNNIAVKKEFQSNKIGRLLMENLLYRLKNKKINKIYLEVSNNNTPAKKLYESIGFQQYSIRKNYYSKGEHALLLIMKMKNYG